MNRSPLHELNVELGGRLVDFGGWDMPVQYESVLAEHRTVRDSAGFFDVSHLGRFSLRGAGARDSLNRLLCNRIDRIEPGRAQYSMMLNDRGGVVDDLIVWWLDDEDFWIMPNAVNQPRVMAAFEQNEDTTVTDLQMSTVMLAVQGPDAPSVIADVLEHEVGRFRTTHFQWGGGPIWMAGTGYTGEKGGELVTDPKTGTAVARALVRHGVRPCGLGARDTLRLEAGFPLWGQDLDENISPLEAGLDFAVDLDHDFTGKEALEEQKETGLERGLTGFVLTGRGIPRHDFAVRTGNGSGRVTSGNMSPSIETGIGLALLSPPLDEGGDLEVEIRGRWVEGTAKSPPLHK